MRLNLPYFTASERIAEEKFLTGNPGNKVGKIFLPRVGKKSKRYAVLMISQKVVIPAQAGIQIFQMLLDPVP
jgi:hypothetical protein